MFELKKKQFIGSREIAAVEASKETTPAGKEIYDVSFRDGGKNELIPRAMFEKVITGEPASPTQLRNMRVLTVAVQFIEVCAEYDIGLTEMEQLMPAVQMTRDENFQAAEAALWGTDQKRWLDVVRVLRNAGIKGVEQRGE